MSAARYFPWADGITAIVPTFRRREALLAALPNHLLLRDIAELVIVDDGSDDGTSEALAAIGFPRVRVIRHPVNRGLPAARNTGAQAATTDWVIFSRTTVASLRTTRRYCDRLPTTTVQMWWVRLGPSPRCSVRPAASWSPASR